MDPIIGGTLAICSLVGIKKVMSRNTLTGTFIIMVIIPALEYGNSSTMLYDTVGLKDVKVMQLLQSLYIVSGMS